MAQAPPRCQARRKLVITDWRKSGEAAVSSYRGPMQLAELRQESEEAYRDLLAAR